MRSPRSIVALLPLLALPFAPLMHQQPDDRAIKSVHLFHMPESVTEAELVNAMQQMNTVVAEIGYPDAGYRLWKAETEDPAYGYYWEGVWPSAEVYRSVHDDPRYREVANDAFSELQPLLEPVETYIRYGEVSGTGP